MFTGQVGNNPTVSFSLTPAGKPNIRRSLLLAASFLGGGEEMNIDSYGES